MILYSIIYAAIMVAGSFGFFLKPTLPPRFSLIFMIIAVGVLAISLPRVQGVWRFLRFIPPYLLVVIHSFRILIEMVLLQFYREGVIPVEMSLYGHNFDIVIGLLALPVAFLLFKRHPWGNASGVAFNILGLLSLANIISVGILSFPSPFRVYQINYLPTYFPGILIAYIAPMALYFHILSLRQLWALRKSVPAYKVQGLAEGQ